MLSHLDDNLANMLGRKQIVKRCLGVIKVKSPVQDGLQPDLFLLEKIAEVLHIDSGSDVNPSVVVGRERQQE